ncbi:sugar transferase [Jannaschia ovalis]|uniref:Sugar transferase n=1 Tax=Jannaschia ovalis TaxID=3038773 RepID=A0ABY8LBP0_9RHOB|nr:sugar transferase [Jannaschia sp. GRR-S6-38]WGH78709.1 sugar transferase [Jannaschia sp. GRR-S6-38]
MPRVFELLLIGIAFLLCALPMIVVALVVRWQLGSQTRAGQGGRPFRVWKFRSMTDARDARGELLPDDSRQTAVTRLLRRTRLDETPQLLNILRRDMALVGPRPLRPDTIAKAGARGERRSRVRPGMTGWAQISGNTKLSEDEKFALDLWYVDHRSFLLDLRILLETVLVILQGERRNAARLKQAMAISRWPKAAEP